MYRPDSEQEYRKKCDDKYVFHFIYRAKCNMITDMSKDGDSEIWTIATRDVRKLGAKDKAVARPARKNLKPKARAESSIIAPAVVVPSGGGIDRKTADRVRKGEIRTEARLDLHGLNIDSARSALLQFIKTSYATEKRCVLVITGKGRASGTGTIRREFPLWLEDSAIKPFILSVSPAQPKDGGTGAFYIYLRKKK